MNKTKQFICEIIAAALIFGILTASGHWIFALINGSSVTVWPYALGGILFGLIYVPVSWWLKKKYNK